MTGPGESAVLLFAGNRALVLDPATGRHLSAPAEMDYRPDSRVRLGDVDGDGKVEAIFAQNTSDPTKSDSHQLQLVAWSLVNRSTLWTQQFQSAWPQRADLTVDDPSWPVVADLDHDGRVEILVPQMETRSGRRAMYGDWAHGELLVLEGGTGKTRWRHEIPALDEQPDHFIVGPDIDGDGTDDVFVVTLWGIPDEIFVDALSGKSGAPLWHTHQPLAAEEGEFWLEPLQLWLGLGRDAPQVVVQWKERQEGPGGALMLSARTGAVQATWSQVTRLLPTDMDRDDMEELLVFRQPSVFARDRVLIDCVRGHSSEWWRRLARAMTPVSDLNRDGIVDFVDAGERGEFVAYSGRDGARLWRMHLPARSEWPVSSAEPSLGRDAVPGDHRPAAESAKQRRAGDLNRDGVADILLEHPVNHGSNLLGALLTAVCGRTGRHLWDSDTQVRMVGTLLVTETADLDGDEHEEIICVVTADIDYPSSNTTLGTDQVQLWLVVLEGHTGRARYQQALGPQHGLNPGSMPTDLRGLSRENYRMSIADLDGDSLLDLAVAAQADGGGWELRALQGRTGKALWRAPLPVSDDLNFPLRAIAPFAAGPVTSDGRPGLLMLTFERSPDGRNFAKLEAFEGRTGGTSWAWEREVDAGMGHDPLPNDRAHLRPHVMPLTLAGKPGYCLNLTGWNATSQLIVIDASGSEVARREFDTVYGLIRAWPVRLDSERMGLVYLSRNTLECLDPSQLERVIWRKALSGSPHNMLQIHELWNGASGPTTILVRHGFDDNSLEGISAANGEVQWRCPGIVLYEDIQNNSATFFTMDSIRAWPTPHELGPGMVAFQSGGKVVVRACNPRSGSSARSAVVPRRMERQTDVRLLRPLPWRVAWRDAGVVPMLLWAVLVSSLLVVAPVGFLGWLARRRRFGLKTMLLLPFVTSLALLGATWPPPQGEEVSISMRLLVALFWSPAVSTVAILAWWSGTERWRKTLAWCLLSGLAAAGLAFVVLVILTPLWGVPLAENERYSWQDWYLIWVPVAYVMSVCLVMSFPLTWAARGSYRVYSLWRQRPV